MSAAARELFTALWREIGEDGDALHRCALAHLDRLAERLAPS